MDGITVDGDFEHDNIAFPPLRTAEGPPLPDTSNPQITDPVQPPNGFLSDEAHTSTEEASDEDVTEDAAANSDDDDKMDSSVTLESRLQIAAGWCAHTCHLDRIDISITSNKQKLGCHY